MKISLNNLFLVFIGTAYLGVSVSYGDIYLFHIAFIFLILIKIYELKRNNYQMIFSSKSKNHIYIFLLILFWYSTSLFWSIDLLLGLKYLFYLICGFSISASIITYSDHIKRLNKLFNILIVLFSIELIIAFFESFTNFRMPISSYSSIATIFNKEPVNYSEFDNIISYSIFSPPTGFRWNTNDFSICSIIALPFFLTSKKITVKFLGIIAITILVTLTGSRAVFLSLILIYSLYLFIIKKRLITLGLIWSFSILLIFGMINLSESDNPRLNEVANSINAGIMYLKGDFDVSGSLMWRRELIENGLSSFFDSFGLGIGAGSTVANQQIIGPVAGRFTSMHNFWIEILVEGGLIIAAIIFSSLISMVFSLFRISKTCDNQIIKYYSSSLFLSLLGFVPAAIAASSTIYFFPMWILFGLSISVIRLSSTKPAINA